MINLKNLSNQRFQTKTVQSLHFSARIVSEWIQKIKESLKELSENHLWGRYRRSWICSHSWARRNTTIDFQVRLASHSSNWKIDSCASRISFSLGTPSSMSFSWSIFSLPSLWVKTSIIQSWAWIQVKPIKRSQMFCKIWKAHGLKRCRKWISNNLIVKWRKPKMREDIQ